MGKSHCLLIIISLTFPLHSTCAQKADSPNDRFSLGVTENEETTNLNHGRVKLWNTIGITSESKSGVEPSSCVELAKHVSQGCPNLEFCGLMTIGMPEDTSIPENFETLANCRREICKVLGIPEHQCELSVGMSSDFEQAIEMGITNVRIGSTIFGAREYPKKK